MQRYRSSLTASLPISLLRAATLGGARRRSLLGAAMGKLVARVKLAARKTAAQQVTKFLSPEGRAIP